MIVNQIIHAPRRDGHRIVEEPSEVHVQAWKNTSQTVILLSTFDGDPSLNEINAGPIINQVIRAFGSALGEYPIRWFMRRRLKRSLTRHDEKIYELLPTFERTGENRLIDYVTMEFPDEGAITDLIGTDLPAFPAGTYVAPIVTRWISGERPVPHQIDPLNIRPIFGHLAFLESNTNGYTPPPTQLKRSVGSKSSSPRPSIWWHRYGPAFLSIAEPRATLHRT